MLPHARQLLEAGQSVDLIAAPPRGGIVTWQLLICWNKKARLHGFHLGHLTVPLTGDHFRTGFLLERRVDSRDLSILTRPAVRDNGDALCHRIPRD